MTLMNPPKINYGTPSSVEQLAMALQLSFQQIGLLSQQLNLAKSSQLGIHAQGITNMAIQGQALICSAFCSTHILNL